MTPFGRHSTSRKPLCTTKINIMRNYIAVFMLFNCFLGYGQSFVNFSNTWFQNTLCSEYGMNTFYKRDYFFVDSVQIDSLNYFGLSTTSSNIDDYYLYREIDGKIYYRAKDGLSEEYLIYDFNANIGDTLEIGEPTLNLSMIVVGIDSFELSSGAKRKRLKVESELGNYPSPEYWIEGIGSFIFPFNPERAMLASNCETELSCYLFNSIVEFTIDDCQLTSTEEQLNEPINLTIFPNPVSGKLKIETEEGVKIQSVELYNVKGIKLNSFQSELVDLNGHGPGVYFLKIRYKGYKELTRKIVVK